MMDSYRTQYQKLYEAQEYYWGKEPAGFLNQLIAMKPPRPGMKILDIGCGEGKDAVYMAKKGYTVTAFDLAESGIAKAQKLAAESGARLKLYVDDINTFQTDERFDIVYSSGTLQYLQDDQIANFFEKVQRMTNPHGLNFFNVFVEKPFIEPAPDMDNEEKLWKTGQLFTYYGEWKLHTISETIFTCESDGTPHRHCMDSILAEKMFYKKP